MKDPFIDGFKIVDRGFALTSLALPSLRMALRSYFSTYQAMSHSIHLFDGSSAHDQKTIDTNHNSAYIECGCEIILHFHHFIEVALKEFLAAVDPVLAAEIPSQSALFIKVARKIPLTPSEKDGLKSTQFRESLDRMCDLIGQRGFPISKYGFFQSARAWLHKLNGLRNRFWHRGTFMLRYPALDEIVGKHILPLVLKIVRLAPYQGATGVWKYSRLSCRLRPIEEIIKEYGSATPDIGKVALLKELARAAYKNPITESNFARHRNDELRKRAEGIAALDAGPNGQGADIRKCPVCGCRTLVAFDDVEESEDSTTGKTIRWSYDYKVTCTLCSFALSSLKNPKDYGLKLPKFWKTRIMRPISRKKLREILSRVKAASTAPPSAATP